MKNLFTVLLVFIISSLSFTQVIHEDYFKENSEVYFKFLISNRSEINTLTRIVSIDNVDGNIVFAYANEKEFREFEKLNYSYTILPHPGKLIEPDMSLGIEEINDWDVYPTYSAYLAMMYQFQANYPDLCRIVDAGNTVLGRKILFAVISDNVNLREAEPQFMYTSSMHGDELTGYVLMLRLIDSLLTTYGTNARITNLVNNVEIWINPLANPDGTYHSGDNTVSGATRSNANGYDLNRNFPDPVLGVNPYEQIETSRFRTVAENNNFALVANFHGGVEVVNYPWDTWTNTSPDYRHHPDEAWYQYISHLYADTCQANAPSNYMDYLDDGITNGGDWYIISYGRQDYSNYFRWGREVTIEISDIKLLPAGQLPDYWKYNRKSFINYMETVLKGVSGVVTNTEGNPVKAEITVLNHDADNSEVYSDSTGFYLRMLSPGTYSLRFDAPDYETKIIDNVVVNDYSSLTTLNVQLVLSIVPVELVSFSASVNENNVLLSWTTSTETNNMGFEIERNTPLNPLSRGEAEGWSVWEKIGFIKGCGTCTELRAYSFADKNLSAGKYQYRLKQIDLDGTPEYYNIIDVEIILPLRFTLEQNYPNPFNPSTIINYSIKEAGVVKLKVFDVLGSEVAELVNESKDAGNHSVEFNASNLPSGVYIYTLQVNGYSASRKMLLIK